MSQIEYSEIFLEEQRKFLEDSDCVSRTFGWAWKRDKIGQAWEREPENSYLVTLNRQSIITVLQRFLEYNLSAQDVYNWAEALEARETVKKEEGFISVIFGILSDITLGNDIGHPLTPERAREMIRQLQNAQFDPEDV